MSELNITEFLMAELDLRIAEEMYKTTDVWHISNDLYREIRKLDIVNMSVEKTVVVEYVLGHRVTVEHDWDGIKCELLNE